RHRGGAPCRGERCTVGDEIPRSRAESLHDADAATVDEVDVVRDVLGVGRTVRREAREGTPQRLAQQLDGLVDERALEEVEPRAPRREAPAGKGPWRPRCTSWSSSSRVRRTTAVPKTSTPRCQASPSPCNQPRATSGRPNSTGTSSAPTASTTQSPSTVPASV